MSWYFHEPTPEHWAEAKVDIQKVLEGLPDVAKEFGATGSSFVLEPQYKEYLITIDKRRAILTKLLEIDPPVTAEELRGLDEVRLAYVELMEQLETLQIRLSNYIKQNYPNEKSWLNDNPTLPPEDKSLERDGTA